MNDTSVYWAHPVRFWSCVVETSLYICFSISILWYRNDNPSRFNSSISSSLSSSSGSEGRRGERDVPWLLLEYPLDNPAAWLECELWPLARGVVIGGNTEWLVHVFLFSALERSLCEWVGCNILRSSGTNYYYYFYYSLTEHCFS